MTRAYAQTPEGKRAIRKCTQAAYYERGGKEKAREYNAQERSRQRRAEYGRSLAGKEASKRKYYKRRDEHMDKIRAKQAVGRAIKAGILPPVSTLFCAKCGDHAQEYHHESYEPEYWLTVIPLCKKCHAKTYTTVYE